MLSQGSLRRLLCLVFIPLIVISSILLLRSGFIDSVPYADPSTPPGEKPKPLYKPPAVTDIPPITDNFPLAESAKSPSDIPPIPPWNTPPYPHVNVSTPLFIGFTRNWRLLQQTVVSYLTAGWPPEDIYVIENTGTMHSNLKNRLTLQNPFYINHHRLTSILGINVIRTPTLFTFAQLQNFYTYTALEHGWEHYFWAHMDTIVVSDEEIPVEEGKPYKPLYSRAVEALEETLDPAWGPLATRWFAYDRLALVRTQGFVDVGGWDTTIPFYMTDCDMHERLWMEGLRIEDAAAGKVWDVADTLDDLGELYKRGGEAIKSAGKDEGKQRKEKRRGWDDDGDAGEAARKSQVAEAWVEATEKTTDTASTSVSGSTSATDGKAKTASTGSLKAHSGTSSSSSSSRTTTLSTSASASTTASAATASTSSTATGATASPPSPSPWKPADLNSPQYQALLSKLDILQRAKSDNPEGRNTWQARQRGGQGEPFYRDPDGFEHAVWMWMDFGRKVFEEKWGRGPCDIRDAGLAKGDAWRVIGEWENPEVRKKYAKEKVKEEQELKKQQEKGAR